MPLTDFFIVGGILLREDSYAVDLLNDLEHYLTMAHRYAQDDDDYKVFLRSAEVIFVTDNYNWFSVRCLFICLLFNCCF